MYESHRLLMGKWCLQASTFIFDWMSVKLADNHTGTKSQTCSNSGRIRSVTSELRALRADYIFNRLIIESPRSVGQS